MTVVKLASQGQSLEKVTLSSLAPAGTKLIEKLKTKLTVLCRKDYPITTNFPKGLETLQVYDCVLKKVDSRILQLRRLTVLDLSRNHIKKLPDCFDGTPQLAELKLANNHIEDIPKGFCSGCLRTSLTYLDLSSNKLKYLRPYFSSLKALVTLKLDHNELVCLSAGIERIRDLRFLSATNNRLRTLPAGFAQLQLDSLDIGNNLFLEDGPETAINKLGFLPLVECAARAIRKFR